MRNRCLPLPLLLALPGVLGASCSAAELRGRVVGRDGKQGVEGVVVQAFCGGAPVASGYTHSAGRFLLHVPDGTDLQGTSLMVTRQPVKIRTVRLRDGRTASVTAPTEVLAMQFNPSPKNDDILRTHANQPTAHPKHDPPR